MRARRELQPLLYSELAREDRLALLPDEDRARARRAWLGTVGRNERYLERVQAILDGARARGLDLLPWKGALLAPALYPDPGARPMADLDLLVRPAELDAACALLEGLGLRRSYHDRVRFTPRHAHDVSFTDGGDPPLVIELHYRLFHELAGDASVEAVFARAIELDLLGAPRRAPSWEDHLFAVAVHAATHAFGDSPLWIFDLALLAARATPEAARREAERRGYRVAFAAACRLAARYLPARFPSERAALSGARARLLDRVLGPEPLAAPPARWRSLLARALVTDDPRKAAGEVGRKLGLRRAELGEAWRRARAARGG